jgi:hypothetical protein
MITTKLIEAISITAMFTTMTVMAALPAHSKAWTVEERQTKLMQDINAGQKSGKLTAKESTKLRKKLSNVARTKAKMSAKQNGKLTAEDKANLQKRIDRASTEIKTQKQ